MCVSVRKCDLPIYFSCAESFNSRSNIDEEILSYPCKKDLITKHLKFGIESDTDNSGIYIFLEYSLDEKSVHFYGIHICHGESLAFNVLQFLCTIDYWKAITVEGQMKNNRTEVLRCSLMFNSCEYWISNVQREKRKIDERDVAYAKQSFLKLFQFKTEVVELSHVDPWCSFPMSCYKYLLWYCKYIFSSICCSSSV